jgi:adenine-specific DNA methylase
VNEYILYTHCPVCGKRVVLRGNEWLADREKENEELAAKECGCEKADVKNIQEENNDITKAKS